MEALVKFIVRSSMLSKRAALVSCYCSRQAFRVGHWSTVKVRSSSSQAKTLPVYSENGGHQKSKPVPIPPEIDPQEPAEDPDTTLPGNMKKTKKLKRVTRPMMPTLSQEHIKKFSTVLSVNIVGNKLAWCLLNRACDTKSDQPFPPLKLEMLELKIFNLKSRMHFLRILNEVKNLVKELPASHVCVTEEYPNQVRNQHVTSLCLEVAQARAMFIGTLASQINSPAIVSIKSYALARIFNTFVGREKVSGQWVVQDLIETEANIKMDDSLKNFYGSSDSETKEYLSNVFLLNLAYWIITKQYRDRFDLDRLLGNSNNDVAPAAAAPNCPNNEISHKS